MSIFSKFCEDLKKHYNCNVINNLASKLHKLEMYWILKVEDNKSIKKCTHKIKSKLYF